MAALRELDKIKGKSEPTIPERPYRALVEFIKAHNIPLEPIWEYVRLIADDS